jgi:hypothetical protein
MNKLKLANIIDAIEFHSDEHHAFIDVKNHTVCILSESALSYAENNDEGYPDWQHEEIQEAKAFLEDETNHYIALPTQHDADEYSMMENFAFTLNDENKKEKLLIALQGKGAFRRFKDTAIFLDIENDWYHFRDKRYKKFTLDWCESNGINIEKDEYDEK